MTRYTLEVLSVIFGASTGALAARGKRIDLFGVVVLGLVAAMGGGTLRDLLLDVPVFWVADANFITAGVFGAILTFTVARYATPPASSLQIVDAFSLAFVTMLGTSRTFQHGHAAGVCVVLGVTTGVAGGMLRDILCGEIPLVFRAHINLYATAALAGSLIFVTTSKLGIPAPWNMLIGAGVVLGLRLAALRWQIRLPEFAHRD